MKNDSRRKIGEHIFNRKLLSVIAKICVSVLIFWIIFTKIELSDVIETLSKTDIIFIIFAIGINFAGLFLGVYRWQISLAVQKLQVSFIMLLNSTLISRFLGLALPAFIGGDLVRGYDIFRYSKQGVNVVASILFERICGLMSLVLVGSCALFFDIKRTGNLLLIVPFISVYIVLAILVVSCFSRAISGRVLSLLEKMPRLHWIREKLKSLSEAIYLYRGYHGVWGRVLALSIVYQFLGILFYYVISLSLSLHIPLVIFMILIPIISLVSMTPISPGGLGVKEGMFVLLFSQYGVPPAEAFLISIIGTALYLIIILFSSIVYIARPRFNTIV